MAYINKTTLAYLQNQFSQFGMRITSPSSTWVLESFVETYPRYAFLLKNKDKLLPSFFLEHERHGVIGTITKMPHEPENENAYQKGSFEIWGVNDDILHLLHHLVTCELLFVSPRDEILDMLGDDAARMIRVIFPERIQARLVSFNHEYKGEETVGATCVVGSLTSSSETLETRTEVWIHNPEFGYHAMCDSALFPRTMALIPSSGRHDFMEKVFNSGNLPLLSAYVASFPSFPYTPRELTYPFRIDFSTELSVPTAELLSNSNEEFLDNVIKDAIAFELDAVRLLGDAYSNIKLGGRSLTIPEIFFPAHAFDVTIDAIKSKGQTPLQVLVKVLTIKRILLTTLISVRIHLRESLVSGDAELIKREASLPDILRAAYMKAVNIAYE